VRKALFARILRIEIRLALVTLNKRLNARPEHRGFLVAHGEPGGNDVAVNRSQYALIEMLREYIVCVVKRVYAVNEVYREIVEVHKLLREFDENVLNVAFDFKFSACRGHCVAGKKGHGVLEVEIEQDGMPNFVDLRFGQIWKTLSNYHRDKFGIDFRRRVDVWINLNEFQGRILENVYFKRRLRRRDRCKRRRYLEDLLRTRRLEVVGVAFSSACV